VAKIVIYSGVSEKNDTGSITTQTSEKNAETTAALTTEIENNQILLKRVKALMPPGNAAPITA
jgi:hypothetical protein